MVKSSRSSGKFVLRVGPELHQRLSRGADRFGVSLNAYCVRKLQEGSLSDRYSEAGLDREFLERVLRGLPQLPMALLLFGSFARGDHGAGSDIDLLIVLETGIRPTREMYRTLEKSVDFSSFSYPVNPALVSLPESARSAGSLWLEVALDGVLIWEKDSRVSDFIRDVRRQIASGEVRRAFAYGQPYWIRSGESE
ncbi:MAG: toxin-antitoxin system HicB family antitoxin [Deltaproteobacteria bacterium]|nr:toxin-antitoxin system HicB family antitoxin [Deltaproteobacteria bacterium]